MGFEILIDCVPNNSETSLFTRTSFPVQRCIATIFECQLKAAALAFRCPALRFLLALVVGVSSSPFALIPLILLLCGGVDRLPTAGGLLGVRVSGMRNVSEGKKKQAKG